MRIYALSGLGADERVFQVLNLKHELVPIKWIAPLSYSESISSYVKRLSKQIDIKEPFILLGVSFGGLIVTELNKIIKPQYNILISSTDTTQGIKSLFRFFKFIVPWIPKQLLQPPKSIARLLFGAKNKVLLNEILSDSNSTFNKWAIIILTSWENPTPLTQCIKISGESDLLIPPIKGKNTIIIPNGEHFMIVDKAEEISSIIYKVYINKIRETENFSA